MTELTRKQVLDVLQVGWATYAERFNCLSPEAQATFLASQGYARIGDLLAHIIAWWEEGTRAVETMLNDSCFKSPEYDVDAFNARAVERFRTLSELAVIQSFESSLDAMINLVIGLPNSAFQNEEITKRLHMELVGHFDAHDIPQGDTSGTRSG